jgi:Spy/CpxP family protein refolding chaperone
VTKTEILVGSAIFLTCASAAAQRIGTPGVCPPGAICSTNSPRGSDGPYTSGRGVPNTKEPGITDPEEERILKAARQLHLDSDQRAQLDSCLKAQKEESVTLEKAVQEARTALAHALQNGETSLESQIENLASANARVQESQLRRWAALYAVLRPEQQRQLLMMPTPLSQATQSPGIIKDGEAPPMSFSR